MDAHGTVVASYGVALFGRAWLERYLHPVTAYVLLPLFALFDAGVVIDSGVAKALADPVGLGVLFGLLIGTRVGITAASRILIRSGLAEMPSGVNSGQIRGSAILTGVGFTCPSLSATSPSGEN